MKFVNLMGAHMYLAASSAAFRLAALH